MYATLVLVLGYKSKSKEIIIFTNTSMSSVSKLNKDDFESNIMINTLFHLLYTEIEINSHGVYIFGEIKTDFQDSYP